MRHDDLCNEFADMCKDTFNDVEREPVLMPLTGEDIDERTANTADEARSDVRVRSFWTKYENAFFDFRVFYPNAKSYRSTKIEKLYRDAEKNKKKEYNERITKSDHGSFTPMIMDSTGSMGPEGTVAMKTLAAKTAKKTGQHYSMVVAALRCRLAFTAARAAVYCIRGSRKIDERWQI